MATQFKVCAADEDAVRAVCDAVGLPRFLAATLVARGIDTPAAAADFLNPTFERSWSNPYELNCMQATVETLADALATKKHILVFGDFDVDGITATTVMTRGLRALGGHVTPFIPKRFEEGYGITPAALKRVRALKPDVMITVDCGISCADEVAHACEAGIKVLVSDHHEAGAAVPIGVPVVDPKAYDDSPACELAGVGVALKIIQALGAHMGYPHLWKSYLDFAALGTVADLMPMLGENRPLVQAGIERINQNPRPAIAALMHVVGAEPGSVRASNLSFSLVPRLNAAGRMGDAGVALDLMMCDNYTDALVVAQKLEDLNNLRRQIESELSAEALARAELTYKGERALVVAGRGWHEGVKGIVASRLVNRYGVPALLFTIDGEEARGSGRSVGSVNLYDAVTSCADLLTRFGGHEAAVGVTLPAANLPAFTQRMDAYMRTLDPKQFHPMCKIDTTVALGELSIDAVEQVSRLEPFGQENPEPRLIAKNVLLSNMRAVGTAKNHFSCQLTDGRTSLGAILFNCNQIDGLLANDSVVDAAFTPQIDEWRGRKSVKCMLKALEPAHTCSALNAAADPAANRLMQTLFAKYAQGCEGGEGGEGGGCEGEVGACGANSGTAAAAQTADKTATATQPVHPEGRASREATGIPKGSARVARVDTTPRIDPDASPSPSPSQTPLASGAEARAYWQDVAAADPDALEAQLIRAIIGDNTPHAAQADILARLKAGTSTLGVMATGRGKSLIFQVFAAELALSRNKASVFVYPLRALMADQAFHLSRQFEKFGLVCAVLNGETPQKERLQTYDALTAGGVDIVLTTPEYLAFHADELAKSRRIGFVVVDEAHHIGQAKAGVRPAYKTLGEVVDALGAPVVLAVTATSPTQVARDIIGTLPICEHVIDNHSRDNLRLDDQRNIPCRDDYLAHIVAGGGKCVIYVNSRDQSVSVARRLRARVPQLAPYIGFYNAGLGKFERARIEDLFRSGRLQVLVATSAFGEGIDIPDIRHVVLYHMPFSDVEFNQMSGRAGRDGRTSWVHLLYGAADAGINEGLLADMTPARDTMAQIYRTIKAQTAHLGTGEGEGGEGGAGGVGKVGGEGGAGGVGKVGAGGEGGACVGDWGVKGTPSASGQQAKGGAYETKGGDAPASGRQTKGGDAPAASGHQNKVGDEYFAQSANYTSPSSEPGVQTADKTETATQPVHPEGRPSREATSQPEGSARVARVGAAPRTEPAAPPSPSPKFAPIDLGALAQAATTPKFRVTPTSAACAVSVFDELGLIEAHEEFTQGRTVHNVRMRAQAGKVELTDSIRYREGLDEILKFKEFCDWALGSDAQTLTIRITHPITPDL